MYRKGYIGSLSLGLMAAVFAAEGVGTEVAEATERKSIVPAKYAGKYKGGGSDPLAEFIKSQCNSKPDKDGKGGGEFEFGAFFLLCEQNGVDQAQVDKYRELVKSEAQGANGRARMTLRNMLASKVRHAGGKVKDLSGNEHEVEVAKPAVSGAAAKAQEGELQGAAAAATEQSAPTNDENPAPTNDEDPANQIDGEQPDHDKDSDGTTDTDDE